MKKYFNLLKALILCITTAYVGYKCENEFQVFVVICLILLIWGVAEIKDKLKI